MMISSSGQVTMVQLDSGPSATKIPLCLPAGPQWVSLALERAEGAMHLMCHSAELLSSTWQQEPL